MIQPRISQTKPSFFHLDPRATFTLACTLSFCAIISEGLLSIIIIFSILMFIIILGKLLREWFHNLKNISFLALFIFAVKFFSLYVTFNYNITDTILSSSILMLKFLVIVLAFSFFYLSTSPDDFGLALQQTGFPFSVCLALSISMRFFPTLTEEAQSISDAQKSRGLELDKGNIFRRLKQLSTVLTPLIINSIRRSVEVAEAMECRCYGLKKYRTSLYSLKMKSRDFAVILLSLVGVAVFLSLSFL